MLEIHSGFAIAVVQDQIMAAGGEILAFNGGIPDFETLATVEIFAASAGKWIAAPPLPTPVHGTSGAALDGKFYVFGGSTVAGGVQNPGITQVYTPQ